MCLSFCSLSFNYLDCFFLRFAFQFNKILNLRIPNLIFLHSANFRLENGLEKLRSTAGQVDDLKVTLAVQEIELQQKNEAADKLIEMVGVETVKVQSEKALGKYEHTCNSLIL